MKNGRFGGKIAVNYEEILAKAKKKLDRRMEFLDPSSPEHENCVTVDGRYTNSFINMYEMDGSPWTRSFLTGALAYLYYHFKEDKYLNYLEKSYPRYEEYAYKYKKSICHDAGFLFSLYAVALYKVSGDEKAYNLALKAADEMIKRFRFKAGVIHGFGPACGARAETIIDDMMNTAIIMWAFQETGNQFYQDVFRSHIKVTLRDMMRDDYTFRHAAQWDANSGEYLNELNFCGYSCGSVWARGQGWALYGLVNVLAVTGDRDYIPTINGVVNRIISFLPADRVPLWDMNCVGSTTTNIDTSAALIIANAFMKLAEIMDVSELQGEAKNCSRYADEILDSIIQNYLAPDESEHLVEKAQCGSMQAGAVWGDYFFVEALMRKLHGRECPDFWSNI